MCAQLQVDGQRLEPVLEALGSLDWIGQLGESVDQANGVRWILLVDPEATLLEPMVNALLLPKGPVTDKLWREDRWVTGTLRAAL
jgi:membrane protein